MGNTSILTLLVMLLWQQGIVVSQQRMYKSGDVILVGLLPLHVRTSDDKCGEFFRYGLDYVEAMIYAVKQINSNDKILPNVTIGYDIRDFCDSPSLAMKETYDIATNNHITRLFQKYKNETTEGRCDLGCFGPTGSPVVAIIGPVDSSSCLVVASLLKVVQIPAVTAFATSEELSTGFDSFFRTVPSDNQQVKAMADIIDHFNWSYVGVIAVDHSYGRYALRALEHEVAIRRTFCIAMTGYFPQSGYEDKIEHIIASLKRRENIRVIILWSTYTPGLRVIQEAANQKLHERTWLISEGLAMQGPGFFGEEEQHVVDGFIGILHPKFEDKSLEEYLRFMKKENRKSSNLTNPWWSEFYKIENQTKHNSTTGTFESTHLPYTEYLIDAVYAIAHALDGIYRCKVRNDSRNYTYPSTNPHVNPQELIPFLRRVNFKGLTGRVEFDSRGNPLSSSYDVINFQLGSGAHARAEYVRIGTWSGEDSKRLKMNDSRIKWGRQIQRTRPISVCTVPCPPGTRQTKTTACCWDCTECPDGTVNPVSGSRNCTECPRYKKPNKDRTKCIDLPVTNLRLRDPTGIVYLTITCTGIGFVIFTLVVFIKFRDSPVVKSSDRKLSFVLLFGISLCFILAFLYLLYPTPVLCKILLPGRYIVYTICVSVLLVKTNRIVRLFALNSIPTWIKQLSIDSKGQFALILVLNVIQVLLGILVLVLDPPFYKTNVQEFVGMWYSCSHFENLTQGILEGAMFAYLISLQFFCTFYAFKARKLPENFNEARYIGFCMYILVFSWISFYPIASAIEGHVFVHIACITTLVSAYGMLGCLFCPKLYIILIHPEKNTTVFVKASVVDYTIRSVSKISLSVSKSSLAQ